MTNTCYRLATKNLQTRTDFNILAYIWLLINPCTHIKMYNPVLYLRQLYFKW